MKSLIFISFIITLILLPVIFISIGIVFEVNGYKNVLILFGFIALSSTPLSAITLKELIIAIDKTK